MTNEEIEVQAEEYMVKKLREYDHEVVEVNKDGEPMAYILCHTAEVEQAFQDGAKWGIANAIQWHDLRKNSNDLPKEVNKFIIIALYNCITEEIITTVGTYEEFGNLLIGNVIAWCELPQFKE